METEFISGTAIKTFKQLKFKQYNNQCQGFLTLSMIKIMDDQFTT
jgi:hypothetical protein